jgi:signal transduction histidine kinase
VKRRLTVLVLAVTSLVVVSFTVPLAALVQRNADAAARTDAENLAQAVASNVVRLAAGGDIAQLASEIPTLPSGIGLVFPTGATAGTVTDDGRDLAATAAAQQRGLSTYTTAGWELALPVLTREGAVVVTASVPRSTLRAGVNRAWTLLAALGVAVIGVSLALAARLGRSLTRSVATLGDAARSLASGDLTTRVAVDEPPELAAVAAAFNEMAPRLETLIEREREEVADLSHRLRTPLARLRLQVEAVTDEGVRASLIENLDRLDRAVDEVIAEARRRPERLPPGVADVATFLEERGGFWSLLAEEQGRRFAVTVDVPPGVAVSAGEGELTVALDTVLGNVFDHTDEGVAFVLRGSLVGDTVVIGVDDAGPGLPSVIDPVARGVSGAGSSGLGLDIARRTAERVGGALRVGPAVLGGASVEFVLPVISRRS